MKKVFKTLPLDITGIFDLESTLESIKKSDIGKALFEKLLLEDQYMILINNFALINPNVIKQVMANA